jgi:hypothetical protein
MGPSFMPISRAKIQNIIDENKSVIRKLADKSTERFADLLSSIKSKVDILRCKNIILKVCDEYKQIVSSHLEGDSESLTRARDFLGKLVLQTIDKLGRMDNKNISIENIITTIRELSNQPVDGFDEKERMMKILREIQYDIQQNIYMFLTSPNKTYFDEPGRIVVNISAIVSEIKRTKTKTRGGGKTPETTLTVSPIVPSLNSTDALEEIDLGLPKSFIPTEEFKNITKIGKNKSKEDLYVIETVKKPYEEESVKKQIDDRLLFDEATDKEGNIYFVSEYGFYLDINEDGKLVAVPIKTEEQLAEVQERFKALRPDTHIGGKGRRANRDAIKPKKTKKRAPSTPLKRVTKNKNKNKKNKNNNNKSVNNKSGNKNNKSKKKKKNKKNHHNDRKKTRR